MNKKKAQELLYHIKKTYNEIAEEFSASRQYIGRDFEIFKKYLRNGQRIVDLGCGNGRLISFLEKNLEKFEYLGIDNSGAILKEALKNHPGYQFINGDQLKLPLLDNSVDIFFNIRAFHHIPSKRLRLLALKEIHRTLKDNGLLILTVWNLWQKKQTKHLIFAMIRYIFSLGSYHYKDTFIPWGKQKQRRYYHAFTKNELKKLFYEAGFTIVELNKDRDIGVVAKKINERIKILEIPFYNINLQQATRLTLSKLMNQNGKAFFIATPNPEMLLETRKNPEFKKILQKQTDLNIPDGFGVILASKLQRTPLLERVTGTDLMQSLCQNTPNGTKIFLLGAAPKVVEKVKIILGKKHNNIKVAGTYSGSPAPEEEKNIRARINKSGAEILFVAFGAPKQEFWLARNLAHLPNVKIAMGVGGAFDFIAGAKKRAPKFMRQIGLEWLFRLIQEPKRIKRIYNAVIKFPFTFLTKR